MGLTMVAVCSFLLRETAHLSMEAIDVEPAVEVNARAAQSI
jgi:hypothetical protein